ncbi:carbohydrate ABC transporter permease [Mycoplasma miroungirhinis]|uniref:Carbohydrate ABC transporter permease n=1 Tax=Mycoplasma miroungirhinis TaxID=754516 RepID=A0A6M4JDI6_9MOLU|nr:carbohydrate ABC transporter permease [Mycoplasma miroungirhinis]QJR44308.1 carbohydrate ABC transporter permease [Mycoplasma miroungirhinis]
MFQTKLWIKEKYLKKSLASKQEKISKQVETANLVGNLLGFFFKFFVFTFFGLLILFPFYLMISMSLLDTQVVLTNNTSNLPIYPKSVDGDGISLHFENFKNAFQSGYFKSLVMTAGVTAISIVGKIFFSITFGYAFSLRKWKFKSASWLLFLSLLVLPEVALLSGQYKVAVTLGWHVGPMQLVSLSMPFVASVFSGFMYRNSFESIPDSVKESAMIDGASEFKFFVKIAIPMVKSTTWTVGILTAFAAWNSFIWPSLILSGSNNNGYSVLNLWLFTTGKSSDSDISSRIFINIRMAAIILVILPMFITYFFFRKRIMNAISRQGRATKG